jgi:glycosyltransferase involved in cell wall biosynthesis
MLPKVSCILPTGYGAQYAPTAFDCWRYQTYAGERELVVVDNNDVPWTETLGVSSDELAWLSNEMGIKYVRSKRMPVGGLRNLGTQHATGEICITWDEDDWYSPDRVAFQVGRLLETGMSVTGFHNLLYYDERDGQAWKYFFSPDRPHHPYAPGGSQCYRKDWWERHKFEEIGVEDLPFSTAALHAGVLDSTDCGQMYVARIHGNNVVPKHLVGKQWVLVGKAALPKEFLMPVGVGTQE